MLPSILNSIPSAPPSVLLAATGEEIEGGLEVLIVGVFVVFTALISIWILLSAMKWYFATPAPDGGGTASAPAPKPGKKAADADEIPPEIMAVILASVIAVVKGPARIQRVRFISHPPASAWAEHGRALVHTSHRLRKRKS